VAIRTQLQSWERLATVGTEKKIHIMAKINSLYRAKEFGRGYQSVKTVSASLIARNVIEYILSHRAENLRA